MHEFRALVLWIAFFLFIAPVLVVAGLLTGIACVGLLPFAVLALVVWFICRRSRNGYDLPSTAKPYTYKPRKSWKVTVCGKRVGIWRLALSVLFAIALVIFLLLAVLFIIPPIISLPVILIAIGYNIGKNKERR